MPQVTTEISIQQSLFTQVESVARQLKVSHSRVCELALEDFVRRQENQQILAQLNEVYADGPEADETEQLRQAAHSQRRLVEGEW